MPARNVAQLATRVRTATQRVLSRDLQLGADSLGKVGTGLIRRKQCYSVQRWVKKRREILLTTLFTVRATQQYTRILKLQKKKNASHVCYHTVLSVPFVSPFFSPIVAESQKFATVGLFGRA